MSRLQSGLLAILLFFAGFLRMYKLSDFTEFRGDQGRAGLVALQTFESKKLPLAGPMTVQNQYMGPFFYYLSIFLFGIGQGDPLIPALFTAIVGVLSVALIFFLVNSVLSIQTAFVVSLLWAVSPTLISQDRIFWEPYYIPFFGVCYMFIAIGIIQRTRLRDWMWLGIINAILIQLHYFNLFFIGISGILWVYKIFTASSEKRPRVSTGVLVWMVTFISILSPFILFEIQRSGKDVVQISSIIFQQTTNLSHGKRQILLDALDYGGRIIGDFIPIGRNLYTRERSVIFLLLVGIAFIRFSKNHPLHRIIVAGCLGWFVLGSVLMGMYRSVIYDHYLLFLVPAVIILISYLIEFVRQKSPLLLWGVVILGLTIYQSYLTTYIVPRYDLPRITQLTKIILSEFADRPFSFTLYPSESFSDLHYRYFFKRNGILPVSVGDRSSQRLFIVCDINTSCPDELPESVPVLCNEDFCHDSYGEIALKNWQLSQIKKAVSGRVFVYERITTQNAAVEGK